MAASCYIPAMVEAIRVIVTLICSLIGIAIILAVQHGVTAAALRLPQPWLHIVTAAVFVPVIAYLIWERLWKPARLRRKHAREDAARRSDLSIWYRVRKR